MGQIRGESLSRIWGKILSRIEGEIFSRIWGEILGNGFFRVRPRGGLKSLVMFIWVNFRVGGEIGPVGRI